MTRDELIEAGVCVIRTGATIRDQVEAVLDAVEPLIRANAAHHLQAQQHLDCPHGDMCDQCAWLEALAEDIAQGDADHG